MTYRAKPRDSVFAENWGPTRECATAIKKVIAAVGKEPDDRAKLAENLNRAAIMTVSLDLKAEKTTSLKVMHKMAKQLAVAINSNPVAKEATKDFDVAGLCDALRPAKGGRRVSVTEFLVGELLPAIYERRFGAKPVTTHNGGFIKFAHAALKELGVDCSTETIVKAIGRFKKA
jgi:hypothetical protein